MKNRNSKGQFTKGHKFNVLHGKSSSNIYRKWQAMRSRCENQKNKYYCNYGGRGIKVCSRWSSFENFYKDMGRSYKKGLEIDRIDNNGGYSKKNCRWVTREQNQRNKRSNRLVTIDGKTKTLIEWAEAYGWEKPNTISTRIYKGWDVVKAITTPPKFKRVGNTIEYLDSK